MVALWRIDRVKEEKGTPSSTSIYNELRAGTLTKPVAIGRRSVGWPDNEIKAINAARIAGKTDDEIRDLVNHLHARRLENLEAELGGGVNDI